MEREKMVALVRAAQGGDSGAMDTLFTAFYDDVYYFALKTVKDPELACDITQETFVTIITTIGSLQEPAAFVTWMKQVAFSRCTRYFRKKKEVLVDEGEDGETVFDIVTEDRTEFLPDAAVDQEDFRNTILAMLDQLSEEQRSAVMLYYYDEFSVKQIAQIQGVSEGTVKSRLNYARKSIKRSVEDYEKKHDVRLHSVALLPMLYWLFSGARKTMPAAAVEKTAKAMAAAVAGTAVSGGAAAGTVAVATGAAAKAVGAGLAVKIVAGITAVSLVAGGIGIGIARSRDASQKEDTAHKRPAATSGKNEGTQATGEDPWFDDEDPVEKPSDTVPAQITVEYLMSLPESPQKDFQVEYDAEKGTGTITAYNGSAEVLVIPQSVDGITVTHIGDKVFESNETLRAVRLADTVQELGEYSFRYAKSLELVVTGTGLRLLDDCSFWDCEALRQVVLNEGLEEIGGLGFIGCEALEQIQFPSTVKYIGMFAFEGCKKLREVVLPYGLKEIKEDCFAECSSLETVVIPDTVQEIGPGAFSECKKLVSVEIPDSVTSIGVGVTSGEGCFAMCDSLERVKLSAALLYIGEKCFDDCPKLVDVVIPDTVLSIGRYAFRDCDSLSQIQIPEGVGRVSYSAFARTAVTQMEVPGTVEEMDDWLFYRCDALETVVIHEGVRSIGDLCFAGCGALQSVTIPASVTEIGEDVFKDCPAELVICGQAGSYAEQFAGEQGLRFQAVS